MCGPGVTFVFALGGALQVALVTGMHCLLYSLFSLPALHDVSHLVECCSSWCVREREGGGEK